MDEGEFASSTNTTADVGEPSRPMTHEESVADEFKDFGGTDDDEDDEGDE